MRAPAAHLFFSQSPFAFQVFALSAAPQQQLPVHILVALERSLSLAMETNTDGAAGTRKTHPEKIALSLLPCAHHLLGTCATFSLHHRLL
jgi:hypothetical protein